MLLENDELLTPIDKNDSFTMKKPSENDDSFDIENSDELNKLIDKYENTRTSAPELVLQEQQSTEKLPKNNDSFDEALEDLDLVEKEVSQGRSTAPSAKTATSATVVEPAAAEITVKIEAKTPEADGQDEEESVDDFIRKHLQDSAEKQQPVKQEDPLSDTDSDNSDGEMLTPRQSLLTALLRLSETEEDGKPGGYATLNDRELFIFDLEQIMKVLTFKEVCLLVFPCLEIFAVEQEYLKIELFR